MSAQQGSTTIVVGLDFSEEGERALDAALRFASSFPGVGIHVLHVDASAKTFEENLDFAVSRTDHTVEARVKALAGGLPQVKDVAVKTYVRGGGAADQIVSLAAELNADLVVVGTRGKRGLERLVLGSVAEAVVRDVGCPVWIVKPKDHQRPESTNE